MVENLNNLNKPAHFKGKDAIEHVAEAQVQGVLYAAEAHGAEIPGYLSAAADGARETAVILLLIWTITSQFLSQSVLIFLLAIFACGLAVWKGGRSAWLGWSRLERLHRILAQEKWEIDHHRQQERDELKALYAAKGFEGKLLEDVIDVLMADGDRLLRVMVEEEMGLSLESHEHPLKQGIGAAIGSFTASLLCLVALFFSPYGILFAALIVLGFASALYAYLSENRLIPAVVWNIGLGILAFGAVHFLVDYFFSNEFTAAGFSL